VIEYLFNHESISLWSLLGSGMIVAAFGVLALDMLHQQK
jgi:drug/metabolite transporter (DMT)-like permease